MKRSEAIAILKDILYEASGHVAEEINPEWLLHNIEKRLEMLPPLHTFKDQHEHYCATYDNDECTCNPFTDNQWEPEND